VSPRRFPTVKPHPPSSPADQDVNGLHFPGNVYHKGSQPWLRLAGEASRADRRPLSWASGSPADDRWLAQIHEASCTNGRAIRCCHLPAQQEEPGRGLGDRARQTAPLGGHSVQPCRPCRPARLSRDYAAERGRGGCRGRIRGRRM